MRFGHPGNKLRAVVEDVRTFMNNEPEEFEKLHQEIGMLLKQHGHKEWQFPDRKLPPLKDLDEAA